MARHTFDRGRALPLALLLATACPATDDGGKGPRGAGSTQDPIAGREVDPEAPGKEVVQPPVAAEQAPAASARLPADQIPDAERLGAAARSYFEGHGGRRIYIQVDKPLYKPGETVWIKSWDLNARDFTVQPPNHGVRYELVSPKGAVVLQKNVQVSRGTATNDFEIPEGVQGGEYLIRAVTYDGHTEERPIIVSTYEPPRLKKKLELLKKAYGPGDEVTASIKVERPTGEPLANHALNGVVWLDGETLAPVKLTTNAEGGGIVRFTLPLKIEKGDGLLTVMVEDGGITESVSKRIPILLKKLQLSFFPEGGQMVQGLPARLYFDAKNTIGKPADIEGRIVDDHGNAVAKIATHHAGLGRVDFTPATGRTYSAEITKPVGITERYALPLAAEEGCVLRTYDDLDGQLAELRVAVRCSETKKVIVAAVQRNNVLDVAAAQAGSDPAVFHLRAGDEKLARLQGVARVTVFDEKLNPLAERIVFRNRRNALNVEITPDKAEYTPREQVALTIKTTDAQGNGVPAELAVSVVDDTVISFADDKTGHMLSRLFLEPEVPEKVEEPNFFFDLTKPKSALAMDLLMGTRGYRRFEWRPILAPPPPPPTVATGAVLDGLEMERDMAPKGAEPPRAPPMRQQPVPEAKPAPQPEKPAPVVAREAAKRRAEAPPRMNALPAAEPAAPAEPMPMAEEEARADDMPMAGERVARGRAAGGGKLEMADKDWAGAVKEKKAMMAWAPVRVFPAPVYRGDETGPRTDFRETIHWAPAVLTGKDGRGTITFYLSDAVTSFRVFAEGTGGGWAGRGEKVMKSSLPFSMAVKLPIEVSAGDKFLLPLTLTNDRDKPVDVALQSAFGDLLVLEKGVEQAAAGDAILSADPSMRATLAAGARKSVFYPVTVKGVQGKSTIRVAADASGLKDEFIRELTVVPVGFPQLISASGTLKDRFNKSVDLSGAIEGSLTATIKLYPSPVATMISGLDGMLREPGGCFEQTSSTNYPNIMVMQYLRANDIADPELIERSSQLLDRGYKRLVGFETPNKGYEWFGQNPGHEALTAYGLLEFADFKQVYGGVDDEMMRRTSTWLNKRRDGKGGYLRDPKALDSFGGAKPEVTNAYITYAVTEAGMSGFDAEVEVQARSAESTNDAYLLALAANTLLNVDARKSAGVKAAARLAGMQKEDGRWSGGDHSITRSTGINLDIETTALALLALMKAGGHADPVRKGVEWLYNNRGGYGAWNATQATVLALKALTRYAQESRKTQTPGEITLLVNGAIVTRTKYEAGRREPIELTGFAASLSPGANELALVHDGGGELPFSAAIEYRSVKPASDPNVVVDLVTKLEKSSLKMGENVRLTATIRNKTDQGQPMTIARISLPGGLNFQTWQLKELKEKGLIGFWETRAREVVLYFRDMKPGEVKEIPLDLVALIPGEFTGPASSAYLYYSDHAKVWVDGLQVSIGR